MPPKKSTTLTEAELRLMKILWRRGESGVAELVAALPEDESIAYNSVLTTIRILEKKGYVTHRQVGRAYLYRPSVAEQEAGQSAVQQLLARFFGNSREQLVVSLLGDASLTREEVERLRSVIDEAAAGRAAAAEE